MRRNSRKRPDSRHIRNSVYVGRHQIRQDLRTAIIQSKYDWIITTDADCELPEKWLNTYDAYIQQQDNVLIAGPVKYQNPKTFLDHFQNLDFMSLIGSTIGSFGTEKPFMANGANLAYKKTFFYQLNGFEDDANIASGDDVFLLQKAMQQFPNKVHYLKSEDFIVSTKPLNNWKSLFYTLVLCTVCALLVLPVMLVAFWAGNSDIPKVSIVFGNIRKNIQYFIFLHIYSSNKSR